MSTEKSKRPLPIQIKRCKEKTARGNLFPSRKKANEWVMKIKKKRPSKTLTAFRCPNCRLWHIGNDRRKSA